MNNLFSNFTFNGKDHWNRVKCIDMHTGGEPLRIPIEGLPEIPGNSVLEKRRYFKNHYDHLRTGLMFEPRGHADMYGAILSSPSSEDADFDVFFIHNEGYSTMCGHAIIALTKFVFETNLFPTKKENELIINVPAGKIHASTILENGVVVESQFLNVPSFLYVKDEVVSIDGYGDIKFDIAYGGAFYAFVNADELALSMEPENHDQFISLGKRIKNEVVESIQVNHPIENDLSFLYGTIFTGKPKNPNNHSRNVCIFAEGELDRSATGSGVSARAGLHYAKGELRLGEPITIESILGSTMTVEAMEEVDYHGFKSVIPKVSGTASFVCKSEFWFDPNDPYKEGFIFR